MIFAIYFISLAIYGFTEIYLQRKYSTFNVEKQDLSFIYILFPFYMSLYLTPLEYYLTKPALHIAPIITGFALLYVGIIFRIVALQTLRHGFSTAIEAKVEVKLVTTGVYKYVRHPLYSTVLIIAMPGSIIFSCTYCWLFVALTLAGILFRISKEEKFLVTHFEEYVEYSKRTKRIIPFIY
ncbi:MAG: isoprenylcysteine carboxylmethyltransferase family protein [Paludibacter sp.]